MTVFAVFRNGVYRHECHGVYSTQVLAEGAMQKAREMETDSYHEFDVVPFELDAFYDADSEPLSVAAANGKGVE